MTFDDWKLALCRGFEEALEQDRLKREKNPAQTMADIQLALLLNAFQGGGAMPPQGGALALPAIRRAP